MDSELEVIDAFVDGERVNTAELKAVLATESGRDYFVDAWMLREAVLQEPEAGGSTSSVNAVSVPTRPTSRVVGRWLVPAALAAGVAAGYFAGYRQTGVKEVATRPPAATTVASVPTPKPVFPVPPPTRVIQLEFRADSADANKSGGD
jgi:hypothetical protein